MSIVYAVRNADEFSFAAACFRVKHGRYPSPGEIRRFLNHSL